ncbi:MAG: DUF4129 domain-containing protein [Candidatus Dormiibacterota bacterium]
MRRTFVAGVIGLGLMTGVVTAAAPARAAASCVTLEYIALLGRADAALMSVPAEPAAALAALTQAESIAPSSSRELAPILAALGASPPDVTGSRQRIDLIVTTLALPSGSACTVDSRAAENALHQVYASSVFADLDQNPSPSLLERIGAVINSILSHLFGLLGNRGSILLGLLVLGAITAFVIYRLRGVAGGRRALGPDEPATAGDDPEREWQHALASAQRGDYREAIRRAFRSALLEVADRRAHLDRAWTTREMLATLSGDAELLAAVAPAAASFDRAWYGGAPVGADDWEVARGRCESVRRVARRAAGALQP